MAPTYSELRSAYLADQLLRGDLLMALSHETAPIATPQPVIDAIHRMDAVFATMEPGMSKAELTEFRDAWRAAIAEFDDAVTWCE